MLDFHPKILHDLRIHFIQSHSVEIYFAMSELYAEVSNMCPLQKLNNTAQIHRGIRFVLLILTFISHLRVKTNGDFLCFFSRRISEDFSRFTEPEVFCPTWVLPRLLGPSCFAQIHGVFCLEGGMGPHLLVIRIRGYIVFRRVNRFQPFIRPAHTSTLLKGGPKRNHGYYPFVKLT